VHGLNVKNRKLMFALIATVMLIVAMGWVRSQLAIDACLDGGGSWDYKQKLCDHE
jgi:hypothetical protein